MVKQSQYKKGTGLFARLTDTILAILLIAALAGCAANTGATTANSGNPTPSGESDASAVESELGKGSKFVVALPKRTT